MDRLFDRFHLGVQNLLGMIFPRSGAVVDASTGVSGADDQAALDRAAALEAANARIRELEGLTEAKIREEAEKVVGEIFPGAAVPEPGGRYRRDDTPPPGDSGAAAEPPTEEQRIATLEQRQTDMEIEAGVRELNERLAGLSDRYPNADHYRVLGQIARAGNAEVNVETLVRLSHEAETRKLDSYYSRRRAEEANATRGANPPPIPGNPAGTSVSDPPITSKNAARILADRLKSGWKIGG